MHCEWPYDNPHSCHLCFGLGRTATIFCYLTWVFVELLSATIKLICFPFSSSFQSHIYIYIYSHCETSVSGKDLICNFNIFKKCYLWCFHYSNDIWLFCPPTSLHEDAFCGQYFTSTLFFSLLLCGEKPLNCSIPFGKDYMLQDNRPVFFILDKSCIVCTSLGKQNSHKNSITKNGVGENLDPLLNPFHLLQNQKKKQ